MNQRYYALIAVIVGLFLISRISVAQPQPDWINGSTAEYPDDLYMSATGSASNDELAKNRALVNLSKIFESHIRATSITKSSVQVELDNGGERYTRNHSIVQQIQLRTNKIINGARIAQSWKDTEVLTYHSLAVLNRTQASNNIRQEIQQLDFATQIALEQSQLQQDDLLSLSAQNKSVELQSQRLALHKMLKVIDLKGQGYPSRWNLSELKGQLEIKLLSLGIAAAVDNDPVGKLEEALKSAMGNAGFPAKNTGSGYTLVANLDVQDLGLRQGWYWLRGKLAIKMISSDGKIRGRKQWSLKVSALQHIDTEGRLMTQINDILNTELKHSVLQIATSAE